MKTCPHCQQKNLPDAMPVCYNCGHRFRKIPGWIYLTVTAFFILCVLGLTGIISIPLILPRSTAPIPVETSLGPTSASLSPTASTGRDSAQVPTNPIAQVPASTGYPFAFASDKDGTFDIYVVESPTGPSRQLVRPAGYDAAIWPSFCGNQIAAELQDTRGSQPQWIYLLGPDSSNSYRWDGEEGASKLGVPRCSPNGKLIAYSAQLNSKWLMRISNVVGANRLVTLSDSTLTGYASWFQSSDDVLFMTYQRGTFRTDLMRGLDPNRITDVSPPSTRAGEPIDQSEFPAISPDGSRMAFVCEIAAENWLCLTDLTTGTTDALQPIVFTDTRWDKWNIVSAGTPAWSADGTWVYFSSADRGNFDIYRIHPDGRGRENITESWSSNEIMPTVR